MIMTNLITTGNAQNTLQDENIQYPSLNSFTSAIIGNFAKF